MKRLLLLCLSGVFAYHNVFYKSGLEAVIRERATDNQLIIFAFSQNDSGAYGRMWTDMMVALAQSLDRIHPNYIVIAQDDKGCDTVDWLGVYCVTNSVLNRSRGYGQGAEQLWVIRYHTAALLSRAGVGVTLLDSDCVVTRPFLPVLQELEKTYALILMRESPANGGVWHLRASNASSAALWIISQVERVSTIMMKNTVHANMLDAGHLMDQIILGDALRVANTPEGSAFDWWEMYNSSPHKDHEMWQMHPQKQPTHKLRWEGVANVTGLRFAPSAGCEDQCVVFRNLLDYGSRFTTIRTPFDSEEFDDTAPPELVLEGPDWLWSHGDKLEYGFDKEVAVFHLLGIEKFWINRRLGSHAGRFAQWLMRPGMEGVVLNTTRPFMQPGQHLVDLVAREGYVRLKTMLASFIKHAINLGHMPVLPKLNCSEAWISQDSSTALGYMDHRVVDDGKWCYPSPAGYDTCWPNTHYVYEPMVREQLVVKTVVFHDTNGTEEFVRYQKDCPHFFNPN